jgi:spore coat protein A, manganese oxidase
MQSRRDFIKTTAIAGAGLALCRGSAWAFGQTPAGLSKFIQALPGLGPNGIPVATPNTTRYPGADFYQIEVGQYQQQFHPDLPPSTLRGYADTAFGLLPNGRPNHRYLGGVIVAKNGRPVWLNIKNNLPDGPHPLPVDPTIMGVMNGQNDNRICTHLHGGFVPWTSDGGPFVWVDPHGNVGPSFVPSVNGTGVPGEIQLYYPNQQSNRLMWYHDHTFGITRLNAYVGIASAYLLVDDYEQGLVSQGILPANQIPLVIQDKSFVSNAAVRSGYIWGKVGDLWYPYLYETAQSSPTTDNPTGRWNYGPFVQPPAQGVITPLPIPAEIPEYFSDTIVVNGAAWPYLEVQPRHYRFRILNGSQARFYNLQLYYEGAPGEADLSRPGPRIIQIGSEGGFLPNPVALNDPPQPIAFDPVTGNATNYTLLLASAERADIIIDFSNAPVGSRLMLYSDAPAPFPGGDPRNDYFTGDPDQTAFGGAPTTAPGVGPNTRTLLQFRVTPLVGAPDPASMSLLESLAVNQTPSTILSTDIAANLSLKNAKVRDLTLNEDFDEYGRLMQRLGTGASPGLNNQGLPTWGRNYTDPATETPKAGTTEIWRIFNLTGDTHPVHFHLVNVQVLARQPFDVNYFMARKGAVRFTGPARPADANELGNKETVRMNPMECTTVVMKFELPVTPFVVPQSPRTGGYEYVWHCHILEHEEHDMMRPLIVQP